MNRWTRSGVLVTLTLLAAIALLLGIALYPLVVDDAYITYRYSLNLATGQGFTYNPGRPVLSTTAPLYALLLAAGALVWPNLPALANAVAAVALWAGAIAIFCLGYREKSPWVGALAALLYVLYPLLWLSLGLETAFFLALCLAAILAYRSKRLYLTALLLALATLTRGDGLILTAIIAADYLAHWLRGWLSTRKDRPIEKATSDVSEEIGSLGRALLAAGLYVAVLLPLLAWLAWQFGSPLPATLGAKVAQAKLGVTGFYAHTTYLQGLGILLGARLSQSLLYLLFLPATLAGLVAMWRQARWVGLVVAWGAAHLVGYTILGVTPYYWYYAPLVPALACASALGIVACARWLGDRETGLRRILAYVLGTLWTASLVLALARSNVAMVRALDGPVPPPEDPVSKVLPEAKAGPYEQAGHWLREHAPADALVGVTEVGVIGYYSRRAMVDFLGLLEADVSEALDRGDLYWALLHYQPDYLALTGVSPLYAYDLRADPWFQAAYAPVETIEDARFWGSPVTIYERTADRVPLSVPGDGHLPEAATHLDVDFGGQLSLLGAITEKDRAQPGDVLTLTLYWQALGPVDGDYTVFVHLLGEHERVIAQRDAPPGLGALPTSQWAEGQVVVDPYLVALPEAAYTPDQATWEVGLYHAQTGQRLQIGQGGDNVRFGSVGVEPASEPLHLNFGPVALAGYEPDRLALTPGEILTVALAWEGQAPVQVTVQLVGEAGEVVAQASGGLEQEAWVLAPGPDAPAGAYDLDVLVSDLDTGQPLPLRGSDGQPQSDRARLTKIRLYPR